MVNVHNDTNHISCCFLMDSKLKIVITTKDFWVLNMKDMFFFFTSEEQFNKLAVIAFLGIVESCVFTE